MIKLTIISINFNNKTGLEKTFNSLQNQTYSDFEYIIIDGGSTDGSIELIKNNPKVNYWVSEKDKGVYNAMNKGILKSTGEYIIFMNSGDIFYKDNVLEEIIPHLTTENDIVYGNAFYYNDSGYERIEIPPAKLSFSYLRVSGINHQSVFIKRQLFFDSQLYNEDYIICADWEFFMINICLRNVSYKYVDTIICYYDFSGISSLPENLKTFYKEKEITLKKYFKLFLNDLKHTDEFGQKRVKQFLYIKNNKKITWRFLKWFLDIVLIFTDKKKIKKFGSEN